MRSCRAARSDIVTSYLPFWDDTRLWVIARPLSGFAETFSPVHRRGRARRRQRAARARPGAPRACSSSSTATLQLTARRRRRTSSTPGGYAFLPPGARWTLRNDGAARPPRFHWIRKAYERVEGLDAPEAFVTNERDVEPSRCPDTDGAWATTRFVDPADLRHDMHVNIVTFEPGAAIPFAETHVMEHGLYVLEGKAVYRLNEDWVEVEAGDFMWLRAFCPQACYAGGPGRFRYLLYKDVNRHMKLSSRIG